MRCAVTALPWFFNSWLWIQVCVFQIRSWANCLHINCHFFWCKGLLVWTNKKYLRAKIRFIFDQPSYLGVLIVKNHQSQLPFNLKTIFSRVLSRVKQTIASIKLLIGIGKQGRRTVDNQSRSVLQPFYYVLIKTMAWMTLAKSTNAPCVQAWYVYWSLFEVYRHDAHNDR